MNLFGAVAVVATVYVVYLAGYVAAGSLLIVYVAAAAAAVVVGNTIGWHLLSNYSVRNILATRIF